MVELYDYMSPRCEPEDSKPIFLQDTLAHGDPSSYQVWLQKVQQLRRSWPWPQQSNPIFSQDNPAYDEVPSNQAYLQKDKQLRRHIWKSYFDYMILHCQLDLEDSKPIFLEDSLAHNDASPYQVR